MKTKFTLMIAALLLCLSGCGQRALPLTDIVWEMTTIQGADGTPVAVSPSLKEIYPEAPVRELRCTLDGSGLTLTDTGSARTWSGSYAPGGGLNIYTLTLEGKQGMMSCGIATEMDGKQTKKLFLTVGDYTLNFEAE